MKKILPITIILLIAAFCLVSFQNKEITFILEGKVLVASKPLPGVKIFLKKEDLPTNKPYYSTTEIDGSYTFQINAHENEQIFLLFQKEGFATKEMEYFPKSGKLRETLSPIMLQPDARVSVLTGVYE